MKSTVIWDWNGTLLDDVDVCVTVINELLARRNLASMNRTRYREVFEFPVQRYYESIGFNLEAESFSDVSVEFHDSYEAHVDTAELYPDVMGTLSAVQERGLRQVILSALEEERLRAELKKRGIDGYFARAFGLSDLHARSKTERGRELLETLGLNPSECWMVGDTDHDAEVAHSIGVDCILVSRGHQDDLRLRESGVPVVRRLAEAVSVMFGM